MKLYQTGLPTSHVKRIKDLLGLMNLLANSKDTQYMQKNMIFFLFISGVPFYCNNCM